jgi:hypothetical protein
MNFSASGHMTFNNMRKGPMVYAWHALTIGLEKLSLMVTQNIGQPNHYSSPAQLTSTPLSMPLIINALFWLTSSVIRVYLAVVIGLAWPK